MQDLVISGLLQMVEQRAVQRGMLAANVGFGPSVADNPEDRDYGQRILTRFAELYPAFFARTGHPLDLLESLTENSVGAGRTSLLSAERPHNDLLVMHYRSDKPSPAVCRGLIEGCAAHLGRKVDVRVLPIIGSDEPRYIFEVTLLQQR